MKYFFIIVIFLSLNISSALAIEPNEKLADPILEQRAHIIGESLRCMACQNESIESSNAMMAEDMRHYVRARLQAGDTDDQVIQSIVDHYGDVILFKPPFKLVTAILWFGPLAFIAGGFVILTLYFRSSKKQGAT